MSVGAVVIGGGLAGVQAALDLAAGGLAVTLLEARRRLGGAAFSFRREDLSIDNGQHVFLRCCTAYRGLIDRLGVTGSTALQERLSVPILTDGGGRLRLARNRLPAPWHLAASLARYRPLSPAERWRVGTGALALRRLDPSDPALDRQTLAQWLGANGQSSRAVSAFWDLIALPTLNLPASQASLAQAVQVFQAGLLSQAGAADLGYARAPLSTLHHDAALRALRSAGVDVVLGSEADGLAFSPDMAVVAADRRFAADVVVVAVPPDQAQALLGVDVLPGVERLGASPIVNLHVVYDRTVLPFPFAAALFSPVQWIFDRTASSGLASGQYLAVSLSGADEYIDRRTGDLRELFLPALARLLPPARQARVERFFVTRERAATFRQSPGTQALRPGTVTGLPGVYLAGAWTDTGWPATMEGAVRSGQTAAHHALTYLRTAVRPAVGHG